MAKIDQIIDRYLRGAISQEEQSFLLDFLRASDQNRSYFELKKKAWQNNKENAFTLKEWEAWLNTRNRISNNDTKRKPSPILMGFYKAASAVAAILVITLILGLPALQKQKVVVRTNPGQTIKMYLPDSSSVILNSNSSLEYHPLAFMMKREIKLEGEAYFDIQKRKNTAFRVQSGDLEVKVLGTRFNVNAYEHQNCYKVVLEEGTVNVKAKKLYKRTIQLSPGEMVEISKNDNNHRLKKVNTRLYTSWTKGLLYFYDSSFSDAIDRIENRYGANIKIEDSIINAFVISTTIRDEPLEKVLDLFKKVLPIKIIEKDGTISITLDKKRYDEFTKERKDKVFSLRH